MKLDHKTIKFIQERINNEFFIAINKTYKTFDPNYYSAVVEGIHKIKVIVDKLEEENRGLHDTDF